MLALQHCNQLIRSLVELVSLMELYHVKNKRIIVSTQNPDVGFEMKGGGSTVQKESTVYGLNRNTHIQSAKFKNIVKKKTLEKFLILRNVCLKIEKIKNIFSKYFLLFLF